MQIKAINTIIHWDAGQMVVINPGETGELSDKLANAEIDAGNAAAAGKKAAPAKKAVPAAGTAGKAKAGGKKAAAGNPLTVGKFTLTYKPVGQYEITGPGLDAPETVKGKDAALERARELDAAEDGGNDGAPPA